MDNAHLSTLLIALSVLALGVFVWRRRGLLAGGGARQTPAAAAPLPNRSFYCLALAYDFDGGRASTELSVFRSLEFIHRCVEQVLLPPGVPAREHVLWLFSRLGGRATAEVYLFIEGRVATRAPLVEHLRVRAGAQVLRLDVERTQEEAARLAPHATLELDWAAVVAALPALTGTVLLPAEGAEVVLPPEWQAAWPDEDGPATVQYGYQDLGYPDAPAHALLDDPDPPPMGR